MRLFTNNEFIDEITMNITPSKFSGPAGDATATSMFLKDPDHGFRGAVNGGEPVLINHRIASHDC